MLSLSTNLLSPTVYDYEAAWKKVILLEQEGNFQSALKEVETIFTIASKEGNNNQKYKAIVYKVRYTLQTNEDGFEKSLEIYTQEIQKVEQPFRAILLSQKAKILSSYFNQNRYKISQRTEVEDGNIRTMSTQAIMDTITSLYLQSVSERDALLVDADQYQPLLTEYNSLGIAQSPTLYDILVTECLSHLGQGDRRANIPSQSFTLNNPAYLSTREEFINIKINSKDEQSPLYQALQLFQTWQENRPLTNPAGWQAEKQRLDFVRNNYRGKFPLEKYQASLIHLAKNAKSSYSAKYYLGVARTFQQNNNSTALGQAIDYAYKAMNSNPDEMTKYQAKSLIFSIEQASINLNVDEAQVPEQAFYIKANHRNIDEISIVVSKYIGNELIDHVLLNRNIKTQGSFEEVYSMRYSLENPMYINKESYISIKGLPVGYYRISVTDIKNKGTHSYVETTVTDLSAFSLRNQSNNLFVSSRSTGAPIKDVTVHLYKQRYDYNTRKNISELVKTVKTDVNGIAAVKNSENGLIPVLQHNDQTLITSGRLYMQEQYDPKDRRADELYLDRAIYRPGQLVYFKGLALLYKNLIPQIVADEEVNISLFDANGQLVSETKARINSFGSFTGTFTLPQGLLTGNFSIRSNHGNKNFKVEEYKRPTFEVIFKDGQDQFSLGDSVSLVGKARGYAGEAITGGIVKYSVYRALHYPRYCYFPPYPAQKEMIKVDETTTDGQGSFNIEFIADAVETENIFGVSYHYTIEAEVIDPSGETRSASKSIAILNSPYKISIDGDKEFDINSNLSFEIKALALDSTPIQKKGAYSIYKMIQGPQLQSRAVYNNESTFIQGELVGSGEFLTNSVIQLSNLDVGIYRIIANVNETIKQRVREEKTFYVNDRSNGKFALNTPFQTDRLKESYEVGETAEVIVYANTKPRYAYVLIHQGNKIIDARWMFIQPKGSRIPVIITEEFRGGITVQVLSTSDNYAYDQYSFINVPWTNKELTIKFESFRDQLLPGIQESYKLHIANKDGTPVSGELLMAMYDASLDQFVSNYWNHNFHPTFKDKFYPNFFGFQLQYGRNQTISSNIRYPEQQEWPQKPSLISPLLNNYYGNDIMEMADGGAMPRTKRMSTMSAEAAGVNTESEPSVMMDETEDLSNVGSTSVLPESEVTIPQLRENLEETVFFYPQINVNKDGSATIAYTINEALTRWKLMTMVHDENLAIGYDQRYITTQKDVMIIPNVTRYLRQGDQIMLSARIVNLTDKDLFVSSSIQLEDALNNSKLTWSDKLLISDTLKAGETKGVQFLVDVPTDATVDLISCTMLITSDGHQDAQRNILPVLTEKVRLVATLPLFNNGKGSKSYRFDPLAETNVNQANKLYTIEYTANPEWYALQALPYLSTSYEAYTTSLLDAYYGNKLGENIMDKHPMVTKVFQAWKTSSNSSELKSNLSKNEELKNILLSESPWVMEAIDEERQKQSIVTFFNKNNLSNQLNQIELKLKDLQNTDGSLSWTKGGRSSIFTTAYFLRITADLQSLGIASNLDGRMIEKAIEFIDLYAVDRYEKIKNYTSNLEGYRPSNLELQLLYIRSSFENKVSEKVQYAYQFFADRAKESWTRYDFNSQAILGMYLLQDEDQLYKTIANSLLERSFHSEELGRYWNYGNGFEWQQLPIETHTSLLSFLVKADTDPRIIDELKVWLLKNKEVNRWPTSSATTSAVHALLLQGSTKKSSLTTTNDIVLSVGSTAINGQSNKGSGYLTKSFSEDEINDQLAEINIENKEDGVSFGGAYLVYLKPISEVKSQLNSQLRIEKKLYKKVTSDKGEQLVEIGQVQLSPGDIIVSRLIIVADRDYSFITLIDQRAAGFEPQESLSGYRYQGRLGYYHNIRDVSDHYFINRLPKGTHVFESEQRVVHKGKYSGGIAKIQSTYAPAFSSHSQGFSVTVI